MSRLTLYLVVLSLAGSTLAIFGDNDIPWATQASLIEGLRTTSAIVLAATGAWFAILTAQRPSATHRISVEALRALNIRTRHVLLALLASGLVLLITTAMEFTAAIVGNITVWPWLEAYGLRISFAACCVTAALQAWAVTMSMLPATHALQEQAIELHDRERDIRHMLQSRDQALSSQNSRSERKTSTKQVKATTEPRTLN
jgi:hypothetical protein